MFSLTREKKIYILETKLEDIERDRKLHPLDKKQLTAFYQKKLRDAKK